MNTLSVRLRYRPLRLGWCVRSGDFEALRRAIRLSFTIWGGRYNPILPIDDPAGGRALADLFRVDALYAASDDETVRSFIDAQKHLPWPMFTNSLFDQTTQGLINKLVDIGHPIDRIYEDLIQSSPDPQPLLEMYSWDAADPLADVLLCTYGGFPPPEEFHLDRGTSQLLALMSTRNLVHIDGAVSPPRLGRYTVASLNRAYIWQHHSIQNYQDDPGFYIGDSKNFEDLVNYWNLRAADIQLQFFDPQYTYRLQSVRSSWIDNLQPSSSDLTFWYRESRTTEDIKQHFGEGRLSLSPISSATWNGLNVRVPIMYFKEVSALASIDARESSTTVSFAVLDKPFSKSRNNNNQKFVLSFDPGIGLFRNERVTLHAPFIPTLNEYYGRNAHFVWNAARAEPESLGIVASISTASEMLKALNVYELVGQIFNSVGIDAQPSKPGLIASTLVQQMGGLNGCRPFKIAGVRNLIEHYAPDQSFSRSDAMQTILGKETDQPLANYEWLYIEPRPPGVKLQNGSVLDYLLEKGVFRAGLDFTCPSCQLEFWRSLDESRRLLECEYCGHGFNVSRQLRDKDWAFRRSGLFGKNNHQEGAIPVLLTLQQIVRTTGPDDIFTTAMTLKPKGAKIAPCETDFVVVTQGRADRRVNIVIGECKSHKRITNDDVEKLKAVADAFPTDVFDVFVVFARLSPFSPEEIESIKKINGPYRSRAIMLTARELETHYTYEKTAKEFDIRPHSVNFEDMVIATTRVFFEERTREPPSKTPPRLNP